MPITAAAAATHDFGYPNFAEYAGDRAINALDPVSIADVRRALDASKDKSGVVRVVTLTAQSRKGPVAAHIVYGPADGTPLLIRILSGFHPLHIMGGNVFILSMSTWGNAANVFSSATAAVLVADGVKQSTTAHDCAQVTVIGHHGARGLAITEGVRACITILGEQHHLELFGVNDPRPY